MKFNYSQNEYWLPDSGTMVVRKVLNVHQDKNGITYVTCSEGKDGVAFTWRQYNQEEPAAAGTPRLTKQVKHDDWTWNKETWSWVEGKTG